MEVSFCPWMQFRPSLELASLRTKLSVFSGLKKFPTAGTDGNRRIVSKSHADDSSHIQEVVNRFM